MTHFQIKSLKIVHMYGKIPAAPLPLAAGYRTMFSALTKLTSATAIQVVVGRCARVIKRLNVALKALAMVEVEATLASQSNLHAPQTWREDGPLANSSCSYNSDATAHFVLDRLFLCN